MNEQIRAAVVRLIDENGQQVGVVPAEQALQQANETALDLVEVSPNAEPPVCKILDYGKYLYQQRKRESEARKKQQHVQIKEIRLRPKTDQHDRGIKMERARKFLEQGHRVQVNLLFRGREMQHRDLGREIIMQFAGDLAELAKIETHPVFMGRRMSLLLAPLPGIAEAKKRKKSESEADEKKSASSRSKETDDKQAAG